MYIYLDTNLWNALCDQKVDPKTLVTALALKSSTVVFGSHNVFELAKTFMPATQQSTTRGAQLFSYVARFLDLGIPIVRENMELLQMEAGAFITGTMQIDPFLKESDYSSVKQEVGKLASGTVEGRVMQFLADRTQFSKDTRSEQVDHFAHRPEMKQTLKTISSSDFPQWLRKETAGDQGTMILQSHLLRQGVNGLSTDAIRNLLSSTVARCCRGVVYADLYSNWRCANRDSNPRDLIDDMLHVLQSSYCDIYATGEAGQREYAEHLLTKETRVAIYDDKTPIDQWLIDLV